MSHACPLRLARKVELIARDLNNIPRPLAVLLSASRKAACWDIGTFRHWAILVEQRRYELNVANGFITWTSNEVSSSELALWTVCAIGNTDRSDAEIFDHGE
jgi:hypothetical protein